jgi:hypothetical protein
MNDRARSRLALMPSGLSFPADPEFHLCPGETGQVRGAEVLARGEAAGEVEHRRAHHHGVVDVEERGRGQVGGRGQP